MTQTPPAGVLSLTQKFKALYRSWQAIVLHIPKVHRYTFGSKIDTLFLEMLEILFRAQYARMETKLQYLVAAISKLDLLKFFLQIGWENQLIDTKQYTKLSEDMSEVGRMLGGWKKGLETKLSPKEVRET